MAIPLRLSPIFVPIVTICLERWFISEFMNTAAGRKLINCSAFYFEGKFGGSGPSRDEVLSPL